MTAAQQAIRNQGRTVTWVAAQLGMERSTLSKMLNGERPLPATVAERLAGLLGVAIESTSEEVPA